MGFFSWLWKKSFTDSFWNQKELASKVSREEIEQWKNKGLSGSEAGKSYNNGWTDPNNPPIVKGRITSYKNHEQRDDNLNPVTVNKVQLDNFYQLLLDISQVTDFTWPDLITKINSLNYQKLPVTRQKRDLLISWEIRRYWIIRERIVKAETVAEVENLSIIINGIEEANLPTDLKKANLFKVQNEKLNNFLNEKQKQILHLVVNNRESIFFTGAAGTGKSFLLRRIIKNLKFYYGEEKVAVTATTGVAAVNIGGTTLNYFAGVRLGDSSLEDMIKIVKKSEGALERWRTTETLIIDEVSMLPGELFDKLEVIARIARSSSQFFGGLSLILSGDFFQLRPVSGKFLFESQSWRNIKHFIQLKEVQRQKELDLIELLNEMRVGEISKKNSEFLRSLARESNFPNDGLKPTLLCATNKEAKVINDAELEIISSRSFSYRAIHWKNPSVAETFKNSLISNELHLKTGAQVMLIKNLSPKLVNGSCGIVIGFVKRECKLSQYTKRDENGKFFKEKFSLVLPVVHFANGIKEVIEIVEWKNETPVNRIVRESCQQIPLILSWAITIHKSQGQTIERLKVDCRRIFAPGQLYVALSRATSTRYLQVINFTRDKLLCDKKVKDFYLKLN